MSTAAASPSANGIHTLRDDHAFRLRSQNGLSSETLAANHIYTETDGARVQRLLGWKYKYNASKNGPLIGIPYLQDAQYVRFRRLKERIDKDGKRVKYESPIGKPNRAYFPAGLPADFRTDVSIALAITEGEWKALKATQEGIPTISIVGVEGWSNPRDADGKRLREQRELISDLAEITWQGRRVYVIFDSDAVTKPEVQRAESSLAAALKRQGADVRIVRLPPSGDDKVGMDDFLLAHSVDELQVLIDAATEPPPPPAPPIDKKDADLLLSIAEEMDDPFRLARLHQRPRRLKGHYTRRFWNGEFIDYNGSAYQPVPIADVKGELVRDIKNEFDRVYLESVQRWREKQQAKQEEGGDKSEKSDSPPPVKQVTTSIVANTMQALQSISLLTASQPLPSWLEGDGPDPADLYACRNAIVNLPALIEGRDDEAVMPTTPRYFSLSAADLDFISDAPEPTEWLRFLDSVWPHDQDARDTLAELFGYLLTPDTRLQKIAMLVGPPRSGKGTIARVIRWLLGEANVAGPTLSSLGANFGLTPLIGKPAAIISDARLGGRSDLAVIIERLLAISGEDAQTIDRKFLTPLTMKLPTRFVVLTNELPRIADASGALASRFIILRMTESFLGREDTGLIGKLRAELPGILLWAIDGWQRLRERGHFVQPQSALEDVQELQDLASPTRAFVRDWCDLGPEKQVGCKVMFTAWQEWCEANGREKPGDIGRFGRDLKAACPSVRRTQPRDEIGGRVNTYEGIGLKLLEQRV